MLEKINSAEDVKKLNIEEQNKLAEEIRKYILEVVSKNGGHLASYGMLVIKLMYIKLLQEEENSYKH